MGVRRSLCALACVLIVIALGAKGGRRAHVSYVLDLAVVRVVVQT
jgi:hypothetical protein